MTFIKKWRGTLALTAICVGGCIVWIITDSSIAAFTAGVLAGTILSSILLHLFNDEWRAYVQRVEDYHSSVSRYRVAVEERERINARYIESCEERCDLLNQTIDILKTQLPPFLSKN